MMRGARRDMVPVEDALQEGEHQEQEVELLRTGDQETRELRGDTSVTLLLSMMSEDELST